MPKLFFMRPSGGSASAQVNYAPGTNYVIITGPRNVHSISYTTDGGATEIMLNPATDLPHNTGAKLVHVSIKGLPQVFERPVAPEVPTLALALSGPLTPGSTVTLTASITGATVTDLTSASLSVGGVAVVLSGGPGLTRTGTIPADAAEGAVIAAMASATASGQTISGSATGEVAEAGGPVVLSTVQADGWLATWRNGEVPAPGLQEVIVLTSGYDASGVLVPKTRIVRPTARVMQAYPNHAIPTASAVSLSDFIYAGEAVVGVENNSALTPLAPLAQWTIRDRKVVGNTLELELFATSRHVVDQEAVACVRFSATDGVNTVEALTAVSVISGAAWDKNAVPVYKASLNITTLAAGHIRANAQVYGHYGDAIHDSAAGNVVNGLPTLHFLKNTAYLAAPPVAVINPVTGSASGVVSTDPAVARASPYLTYAQALGGLAAATAITGGYLDGCEIYIASDYAGDFAGVTSRACRGLAALKIRKDPSITGAVTCSAPQGSMRIGTTASATAGVPNCVVVFKDLTLFRSAATTLGNTSIPLRFAFENVILNNNSQASLIISGNTARCWYLGVTFMNWTSTAGGGGQGAQSASLLTRGCDGDLGTGNLNMPCGFGNTLSRIGTIAIGPILTAQNMIVAYNKFPNCSTTNVALFGESPDTVGAAFICNLVESTAALGVSGIRVSGDTGTSNTMGVILRGNTTAGHDDYFRWNNFYDETDGLYRTHKLFCQEGNLTTTRWATKGDVFMQDPLHSGNWPYRYGTSCAYNFVGALTAFPKEYNGIGTLIAPDMATKLNPMFVNPQQTREGVVPGLGGGDYHLQAGSPAAALVGVAVLKFDLDGRQRPATNDAAGCYAMAA